MIDEGLLASFEVSDITVPVCLALGRAMHKLQVPVLLPFMGLFLLGCVYVAIGMFMSALTESQMIAFITTFGLLLILYLCHMIP